MLKHNCTENNDESFYYIYNRGINKQKIFFDDFDKYYFLKLCRQAKESFTLKINAFCLMNNYYHLLVHANKINLSRAMKYIEERYEKYFAHKYQSQKKSRLKFIRHHEENFPPEENHMNKTLDHIHLNPVKERICEHPEHFRWSSYLSYKNNLDYFNLIDLQELKNSFKEYLSKDLVQVQNQIQEAKHSQLKINTLINSEAMKAHLSEYKVDFTTYKKLFAYCLLEWTELDSFDLERELDMQASSIRQLKNNVKFEMEDNNQLLENLIYNVRKNFGLF